MPESINIYAEVVEDITPISSECLEITLTGVDVSQLIDEIGIKEILSHIDLQDLKDAIDAKVLIETEDNE